jgi:hypothetical protein
MDNNKLDQYKDIVERVKVYLTQKFATDKSAEEYNKKLQLLVSNIDKAIMNKCSKEYEELTKHAQITKDSQGIPNMKYNVGEEEIGKEAFMIFSGCSRQYASMISDLQAMDKLNEFTLNDQLNQCTLDCMEGTDVEACMKKCVDFTYNYTFRTIKSLMNKQIDLSNEQLNKLI